MTVQRYRRKPAPDDGEDQFAARYEAAGDLSGLAAVAQMAGDVAEVREVVFPSGKRVLLAWWLRYADHHPAEPGYVTVDAGGYLAYSPGTGFLYESDEVNWGQFYDLVTGEDR